MSLASQKGCSGSGTSSIVAIGGGCGIFMAETSITFFYGDATMTFGGITFLGIFSGTSSSLSELSMFAFLAACAHIQTIGMKLLFLDLKA